MAEVAGSLITEVLRRVRDPRGEAHARADVLLLLDKCQRIVNAFTDQVFETVTMDLVPTQQVYGLSTIEPAVVDIKDIKEGGRSLPRVPWRSLFYTDREWTRAVASRTEVFAQLGTDLLVLHPSEPIAGSVELTYTKETTTLVDENTATDVIDDDLPAVLDLLEAVLSLRQREFQPASDAMARAAGRLMMDKRK